MAWERHERPKWKVCRGHGREPHKLRYDTGFPQHKRRLKDGSVVYYAGPLCHKCRRAYERELRRENNRLNGKATRPQDIPWKKNRRYTVPSGPFLQWFDSYLRRTGMSTAKACALVGISTRPVRRWRQFGSIPQPATAELFLVLAGQEDKAYDLLYMYERPRDTGKRGGSVDSELFHEWLRKYMMRTGLSLEQICRQAKVSSRTVRRTRTEGRMLLVTAQKIFEATGYPHMTRVLYGEHMEKKAA